MLMSLKKLFNKYRARQIQQEDRRKRKENKEKGKERRKKDKLINLITHGNNFVVDVRLITVKI